MRAALTLFSDRGYAGTSVQEIVDAAAVTKPALYYYFENKAALYQALVDWAQDERFRLMEEAAGRGEAFGEKLVEVFTVLFDFLRGHRELMRLAFRTAFASPGEVPAEVKFLEKGWRNFEFMQALVRRGMAEGCLSREFGDEEVTMGIFGLLNIYVMRELVSEGKGGKLDRRAAERIVELFMEGASARAVETAQGRRRACRR